MEIVPMLPVFARRVAQLHMLGIHTSFLGTLGLTFMTLLYQTVSKSKHCFAYVAIEDGEVLGFVAFTESLGKLYRQFVLKKFWQLAPVLIRQLFTWKKIKGIVENIIYPSKIEKLDLPSTALISIAVDERCRGRGVGQQLIHRGFEECRRRGLNTVRVLTTVENQAAGSLYQKCGFELYTTIENHGVPSRFFVIDLNKKKDILENSAVGVVEKKILKSQSSVTEDRKGEKGRFIPNADPIA